MSTSRGMPTPKPPKPITRQRLRNVALAYVRRYGGSSERLRQVLQRRVQRSLRYHDELHRADEAASWIEQVVEELQEAGTSDDTREARRKAARALLDGRPRRVIAMQLRSKGFDDGAVNDALENLTPKPDEPDADWVACCRLARRRGLGPFQRPGGSTRPFDKQLAILMRAAFPYAMARRVLETEDAAELEAVIDSFQVGSRL